MFALNTSKLSCLLIPSQLFANISSPNSFITELRLKPLGAFSNTVEMQERTNPLAMLLLVFVYTLYGCTAAHGGMTSPVTRIDSAF